MGANGWVSVGDNDRVTMAANGWVNVGDNTWVSIQ
jgi:hypothetical protein